jgi:hypothetical protein
VRINSVRQKNEEEIIKIEFILVVVFAFYSFLVIRANIYPKGNRNGQRERERQEEQKK